MYKRLYIYVSAEVVLSDRWQLLPSGHNAAIFSVYSLGRVAASRRTLDSNTQTLGMCTAG